MTAPDPRWDRASGAILRGPEKTTIVLRIPGVGGQKVEVDNTRLERHPDLLRTTLDLMVRDIDVRLA